MGFERFKPKKSLGQNFLIDHNIAKKIVRSLSLKPSDIVLEIGAGKGMLTQYLLPVVNTLYAIEIDQGLISLLNEKFSSTSHFHLIHADFLKIDLRSLVSNNLKIRVVGNIPYNISSQVIFKVIENRQYFSDMTLMLQRELGKRIVADPNIKDYGILSVICQAHAQVKPVFEIPKTVFFPIPKVDSIVIKWDFSQSLATQIVDKDIFRTIVRTAFGQRRKMLRNSLKDYINTDDRLSVYLEKRPEQLAISEWIEFVNMLV